MAADFKELRCEGVTKHFGPTLALDHVDLAFSAGSVTAIRGANGSGKSTLLSIVAQLMRPTRGLVRYGTMSGQTAAAARGRIALVAHQPLLYMGLSGHENLVLHGRLYGLDYVDKRIDDLAMRLGFGGFRDQPLNTCSRGQLQRIALARALMHEPRLFLLDEPAAGLDTDGIEALATTIREQKELGAIVIVVTHTEQIANRVADRQVRLVRGHVEGTTE